MALAHGQGAPLGPAPLGPAQYHIQTDQGNNLTSSTSFTLYRSWLSYVVLGTHFFLYITGTILHHSYHNLIGCWIFKSIEPNSV